jgi:hypothetical protein
LVARSNSARLSFDHAVEGAVAFLATQEPTFNKWMSRDEPAVAP